MDGQVSNVLRSKRHAGRAGRVLGALLISAVVYTTSGCAPAAPAASTAGSSGAAAAPTAAKTAPAPTAAPAAPTTAPAAAAPKPTGGSGPSYAPPELKTITVPQFANSALMLPTWIALEQGFFKKYGLETVDIPNVPSTKMLPTYISGEFNFGATGGYNIPNILAAGRKVNLYGMNYDHHAYDFYVLPSINSLKDLEGKAVGISEPGGAPHAAALALLKKEGVDTSKVTFLAMGNVSDILTGLIAGQIAGGAFGPPQTVLAQQKGLKRLAVMGPMNLLYPTVVIAGNPDWVEKNPNTAKAYVRGFSEGLAVLLSDKETSIKVLAKRMNMDAAKDAASLEAGYVYAVEAARPPRQMGSVTPAQLQSVADTYQGDGKFDIQQAKATRDLFGEIEKEGFYDELYQKYRLKA